MAQIEVVTLTTAIVGAVCGVLGTVLGIVNSWWQWNQSRVHLRVVPKIAFVFPSGGMVTIDRVGDPERFADLAKRPARFCIEVTNLSTFPVTIHEVGYGRVDKGRYILVQPDLTPARSWPVRLQSRESVVAYAQEGIMEFATDRVECSIAFARTDCGHVRYGSSQILKKYIEGLTLQQMSKGIE